MTAPVLTDLEVGLGQAAGFQRAVRSAAEPGAAAA